MLEDLIKERLKKRESLSRAGFNPYPARIKRTHTAVEALRSFSALARSKKKITVVGRIIGIRGQGGVAFVDISDVTGKIQVVLKKDTLKNFSVFRDNLDVGDFIEITGPLFKTKSGERSIEAKKANMASKSIRPIPSEFYGLKDAEIRLRKRYLDLLLNKDLRESFVTKAKFWDATRSYLREKGFLEVDTPVLEAVPGGADAEPFQTHHNALDEDFFLRISLELPLKRLVVAGYEKVFEIGHVFRNEGIDAEHLQDYSAMEFYWAYHDYNDLMKFVEKMYKEIIKATMGTLTTTWQDQKINWGKKWPKVDYSLAFKKSNNLDLDIVTAETLAKRADELGLKTEQGLGRGRLIDLIYKKTVRPYLIQPCFLINHPIDVSPLAKRSEKNPKKVERVQVVACGSELGNGWSELNDPVDQRKRFEEQMRFRESGDKEAQMIDEDYLEAMEYGMPPIAGFGFSERLFAFLMDKPVRETVIFPLMRRK